MKFKNFFKSAPSRTAAVFSGALLLVAFFCLTGCASGKSAPPPPSNPLCAVWHVPKAPVPLRISFTPDGRLVGVMGLNNFFAPVRYLPDGVEIYDIAVSVRTEEPAFARKFFQALRRARYTVFAGNKLQLLDASRKKVMTLERIAE